MGRISIFCRKLQEEVPLHTGDEYAGVQDGFVHAGGLSAQMIPAFLSNLGQGFRALSFVDVLVFIGALSDEIRSLDMKLVPVCHNISQPQFPSNRTRNIGFELACIDEFDDSRTTEPKQISRLLGSDLLIAAEKAD